MKKQLRGRGILVVSPVLNILGMMLEIMGWRGGDEKVW